jgi:hypothetical protein
MKKILFIMGTIAIVFLFSCISTPTTIIQKTPETVGLWHFNDIKAPDSDDSGNRNDLTLVGGARIASSIFGSALEISVPTGARAFILSNPSLEMSSEDSFTISALINTSTIKGDWKRLVTKRGDFGIGYKWYSFAITNNKLSIELSDGINYLSQQGSLNIVDGKWHYVAGVRDRSTKKLRLYIDGLLDSSFEDTTEDLTNGQLFEIGNWGTEAYQGTNYTGLIDEVRITKKALNDQDIFNEAQKVMKNIKE